MRQKLILILLVICSLTYGCTTTPGTLPAGLSGEAYTANIPTQGKGPFICAATNDSILPNGLTFQGCTLSGTAPTLEGVSEKTFFFTFTITDSDGKTYGPYTATLPVSVGPPLFSPPQLPDAMIGQNYQFSFCDNPTAFDCIQSTAITGGAGAHYSFSASELPLGLFLSSNGELTGKIPDGTSEGTKNIRVCVIDSAHIEDCKELTLTLTKYKPLAYKVSLNAKLDYAGERTNYNHCGGSAYEKGAVTWTLPETLITLTKPPMSWIEYTSDDYEVITDEYGYSSSDNFKSKSYPLTASGAASITHDYCEATQYNPMTCKSDSATGTYHLNIPLTLRVENSKLSFDIKDYADLNPTIEPSDISKINCDSPGGATYVLKSMARSLERHLPIIYLEIDGGTNTKESDISEVYTYALGAAPGKITKHISWTIKAERLP